MLIPCSSPLSINMSDSDKLSWIKQNQHVCINPFQTKSFQIDFNGSRDPLLQKSKLTISCCCNAESDSVQTITEIQNSILAGEKNEMCNKCWRSENTYGYSERTMALINTPLPAILNFVNNQSFSYYNVSIKFSNLCNLSCRSCSPSFSSKYAQTYNLKIPGNLSTDLSANTIAWQLITAHILSIDQTAELNIALRGGESLIQPGFKTLVAWLTENNMLSRTNLDITTNYTNIDTFVVDTFSLFKSVTLHASIDSVNTNFEYIRWPATFNQIEKNLNFILLHQNIDFIIQPLWNLNNIFYINDFLSWWEYWGQTNNYRVVIRNVSMFRPHHLTIENLPVKYRPFLLKTIQSAQTRKIIQNNQHMHEFLSGLRDFLTSSDKPYDQFELFLFETARQDQITNTSMKTHNSKLYNLLDTEDKNFYNNQLIKLDYSQLPATQQNIPLPL